LLTATDRFARLLIRIIVEKSSEYEAFPTSIIVNEIATATVATRIASPYAIHNVMAE
jgi:hypothetical protein